MIDAAFPTGRTADPLGTLARVTGAMLVASLLVPHLSTADGAEYLWQAVPELPFAAAAAALAPALAGVALLVASRACRRPGALALVVLATMMAALVLTWPAGDRVPWDLFPFPESWTHRPSALLALSLSAATVVASREPRARRASRPLLAAALVFLVMFYAWPSSGEAPFMAVVRALARSWSVPRWKDRLGPILLSLVVLWPLLMAGAVCVRVRGPASREHPATRIALAHGLPATLLMVVYRSGAGLCEGVGLFVTAAAAIALTAVLALLTRAIVVLAMERVEGREAWPARTTILVTCSVLASLAVGQWALSRPSHPAAPWVTRPPTPEGDLLFGELIPQWNDARADQDLRGRGDAAAPIRRAAADAVSGARTIDARLGDAVLALTRETDRGGLGEPRWDRLVEGVNDASRLEGLPYYLDPTELVFQGPGTRERWLRLDTWRIEKTRRFLVAGETLTALHVRKMNPERGGVSALGLSRDTQPFALVALDRIDAYEEDLARLGSLDPPRCMDRNAGSDVAERASRRCGELLLDVAGKGELKEALTRGTERHELQHQADGASLPISGWLLGRLDMVGRDAQARVNRELSAHLAQMAAIDAPARLTLLRLTRFILLGRRAPEYYVAWLSLEALSEGGGDCAAGAADCLAEVFLSLGVLDDETLRARARRAGRELDGAEVASAQIVE